MRQFLVLFILCSFMLSCQNQGQDAKSVGQNAIKDTTASACINPEAVLFLGVEVDGLCVKEKMFSRRDNLLKVFRANKLDKYQYEQFLEDSKVYFDFSAIPPKQKYFTVTKETDTSSILHYLIFKVSDHEYVIANCTDTTSVLFTPEETATKKKKKSRKIKPVYYHPIQIAYYEKQIDTVEIRFAAVIKKSVSKTFKEHHLDPKLIERLNKAYNGKFSINSLKKGDTLQFIYDQLSINGHFLDYGHVQAICVKTKKKKLYAVDYFLLQDSSYQYVDEKGKYLKTAFIKTPLQRGGNIVSRYSLHRFHPVLQVDKAHLGTDFAAPQGTPIIATASGIVIAAQFTQNNGNYVKIRHDRTYETQYLHMSRFAKSIRKGVRVQQGQVIGYVGSTGLATGPHVCYRFWKNGRQVDPLREKLNIVKQIPQVHLDNYIAYFTAVRQELDKIGMVL